MNRCCIPFFIFQVFVPFFLLSRPKQKYNPVIMKRSVAPEFLVLGLQLAPFETKPISVTYLQPPLHCPLPLPPLQNRGRRASSPDESRTRLLVSPCRTIRRHWFKWLRNLHRDLLLPAWFKPRALTFSCFPPSPCSLPHSAPHCMQLQRATSTASDKATQRRLGVTILFRLPPPCVHRLIAKPIS